MLIRSAYDRITLGFVLYYLMLIYEYTVWNLLCNDCTIQPSWLQIKLYLIVSYLIRLASALFCQYEAYNVFDLYCRLQK